MSDEHDPQAEPKRASKRPRKKPLSPHYKADNKGGYANPPVGGQFRPGGKPGPGRPPGDVSLATAMKRMLKGQVPLKNGSSTSYTTALAMAARDSSLKKTVRATEFGFSMYAKFGHDETPSEDVTPNLEGFSEVELAIIESLLGRLLGTPPEEPMPNPLQTVFETGEGIFRIEKGSDGHLHLERVTDIDEGSDLI